MSDTTPPVTTTTENPRTNALARRGEHLGEQPPRDASPLLAPLHFLDNGAVLDRFRPVGRGRASKIVRTDPRFPRPLLGGRPGSRAIYSRQAVDAYFDLVEREGFPHLK